MFQLKEHNTSVRIEFTAGLTTFMAMAYILMVNASMFTDIIGAPVSYGAMYVSTALSSVIGSVLIGLLAGLPLAQAPGMGLNAFFVYTICDVMGFSYANTLVIVLFDGILFVLLTLTGLRRIIFDSIPQSVKAAISAGIGLFIGFLGMQNVGLIVNSESTLVDLHSFNVFFGNTDWADVMPILITLFAVVIIGVMSRKQVKGAVFWGIMVATALYYLLAFGTLPAFSMDFSFEVIQPFRDFFSQCFLKVFTEGFDFSAYIEANGMSSFLVTLLTSALAMCMIDMFDTLGTLYGACTVGGILDEEGNIPHMEKAMLADAVATCCGALCGTSTVTTFVEASAGVAEGGRTGLSALFTALFFFLAMFFAPLSALIPGCATAAALIYVGILMMGSAMSVNWSDPEESVPAFLTIAIMPFGYNISYGIAFGLLSHILMKLLLGKAREIKSGTWVIGLLFLLMFCVSR